MFEHVPHSHLQSGVGRPGLSRKEAVLSRGLTTLTCARPTRLQRQQEVGKAQTLRGLVRELHA